MSLTAMNSFYYRFSVLHVLAATTVIACQLGIMVVTANSTNPQTASKAIGFFGLLLVVYIPTIIGLRFYYSAQLGDRVAVVYYPIYRSRFFWGGLLIIICCVVFSFLGQTELVVLLGTLNLVYQVLATLFPKAVIGTEGILHDISLFSPWSEWQVLEESMADTSAKLTISKTHGMFGESICVRKDIAQYDRILKLVEEKKGEN